MARWKDHVTAGQCERVGPYTLACSLGALLQKKGDKVCVVQKFYSNKDVTFRLNRGQLRDERNSPERTRILQRGDEGPLTTTLFASADAK